MVVSASILSFLHTGDPDWIGVAGRIVGLPRLVVTHKVHCVDFPVTIPLRLEGRSTNYRAIGPGSGRDQGSGSGDDTLLALQGQPG